ncbi:paraquat-inducible protein A [Pseudomaricurvus sp.]|uniref:paraquat-inducible protein A n=1 Tax=Pseudomaricurvus sp. TaxID=2004510 RepID=UPI003F6CDD98
MPSTEHQHRKTELIGCPSCDELTRIPELIPGQTAFCPECGHLLSQCRRHAFDKVIAYALTALLLLIAANLLPFLSLQAAGAENTIDLPSTSIAMFHEGMPFLALLVCGFILLLPMAQLLLVLALYVPLHLKTPVPWLVPTGRWVFAMQSWCMVDVFLIALVVSLVKLSTMASIVFGMAFWAYVAFAFCFTLMLTCTDRLQCWQAIEALMSQQEALMSEQKNSTQLTGSPQP